MRLGAMGPGEPQGRESAAPTAPLHVRALGCVAYSPALALMHSLVAQRQRGEIPDTVLLLEHEPVVTLGSRGSLAHVLDAAGIEVATDVGRGGDVTYHGPGQLVVYPILLLPESRRDLHRYLRALEQIVIAVLADLGLTGTRIDGRTGVWVDGAKVAAIGVRASRWVTSHGLAFNLTREVHAGFRRIVPCGIHDARVTSLEDLLGHAPDDEQVAQAVVRQLTSWLGT